ncbi:twin transmembrane helix small protein [Limibaculum sp. M0105]|uniref:Twin transmembrane helix small protein n=1 Tax=Thermohalobaculum xanthum TaxID=2753746 RepID=A0A8J7SDQ4_9RHOB|nr:twin transmembrane helix small protein [Thermohalobaculum xanthum]MBK0399373.1 twin transmembrane helix small protein [Thermohalobaculum xanthum]
MSGIFFYLAAAACLATLAVLLIGIGGFGSGKASPRFSNRMMRYRVIAQAIAIVLLLMMVWFAKQGM